MLTKIRTVLIHNSHPGNIGAAARALKNMGLSKLYLVAPKAFPSSEAIYRAKNAKDIVENAQVFSTLEEALQGCAWIYGTSSRVRELAWPTLSAKEAANEMMWNLYHKQKQESLSQHSEDDIPDVAILYGCEQSGLTNQELQLCHKQIIIPTDTEYASLNLAQAVQIISYELRLNFLAIEHNESKENVNKNSSENSNENLEENLSEAEAEMITFEEFNGFYQHLEQTLINVHFLDIKQPKMLMARLKRLFARSKPNRTEINILRGFLTAVNKKINLELNEKATSF